MLRIAAAILTTTALCHAAVAQTGIWFTGLAPDTTEAIARATSADGAVTTGRSGAIGYIWTRAGGRYDFGLEPGMPPVTNPHAVSSNGSVVAGLMYLNPNGETSAFRWTAGGAFQNLGTLPGDVRSIGNGISGDGAVVVGESQRFPAGQPPSGRAFRWTQQTGMVALPHLRANGTNTVAQAISRDGGTIVGESQYGGSFGPIEAFKWTAGGGMEVLPLLPGAAFVESSAYASSANGQVVVGDSATATGRKHAVRWANDMLQDLGVLASMRDSNAYAVSGDGTIVGGQSSFGSTWSAFIWTEQLGMVAATDYLMLNGVSVPAGWRLGKVFGIANDGLTFVGEAWSPQNVRQGFIATVPAPGAALLVLPFVAFLRQRRR
jgi:probable HAF family extracellular repeat protein